MKNQIILIVTTLLLMVNSVFADQPITSDSGHSIGSAKPSFNCVRAFYPDEKTICSTPSLAQLDRQLAAEFELAATRSGNPIAYKKANIKYVIARRQCGLDVTCLKLWYQSRMQTVQADLNREENTSNIPDQSLTSILESSDQGDANAQNNLGALYAKDQGVAQDHAQAASDSGVDTAVTGVLWSVWVMFALMLASYFAPTIIALLRAKNNTVAIFLLNLFLGWTLVGWVVALVWAATNDDKRS